jgi:mannitol/fructose-specific phosphotransferase system IIA component (Ntr-type)
MANSIQIDTLAQLMIRKGFITKDEFFEMLKEVQVEYQSRADD